MDSSLSPEIRAKDLLELMTVREKAGQLNQRLYGFHAYKKENGCIEPSDEFKDEVSRWDGIGILYGLYRADPWSGRDYASGLSGREATEAYNTLQRYVMEHSRLHIPMLLSTECPHGHQALDGYLLPVNLGLGATFNPKLVGEAYEVCGRQMKALGVDFALISMLDVLRDPRWGRSEECFGEDPYLAARMAEAVTKAVTKTGVGVVAKHFAAQGETTGGVNASAARIGMRELLEIHFPPMAAAAEAGAVGVMAAYNEIDGLPCHANRWLLHDVLREAMGFDGIVMADGFAVDRLEMLGLDAAECGAKALSSGVDVSLWDEGFTHLEEAFKEGLISEERLDEAVLRVLTIKFARGLFEHPFIPVPKEDKGVPEDEANLKLAREGAVLLKNEGGLLPLNIKKPLKIAVFGENSRELYNQLGDYTPPVKSGVTVLDGLKAISEENGGQVIFVPEETPEMAAALAEEADVSVLVLGGSSSRFNSAVFDKNGAAIVDGHSPMDCGEGVDLSSLQLSKKQLELSKAVFAASKKTVTVVIAGRPYDIADIDRQTDALIYSFYPGPKGGTALAEIIFGKEAPSGRLPVSLPGNVGRLPVYYNYRASYDAMHYCDGDGFLYKFGDGLGYGEVCYSDFCISDFEAGVGFEVVMTVENKTVKPLWAVPMLFITRQGTSIVPRAEELKRFEKLYLVPGSRQDVRLRVPKRELYVYDSRMKRNIDMKAAKISVRDGRRQLWSAAVKF